MQGQPQKDELKKGIGEAKKIVKGLMSFSSSGAKNVRCCMAVLGGQGSQRLLECCTQRWHLLLLAPVGLISCAPGSTCICGFVALWLRLILTQTGYREAQYLQSANIVRLNVTLGRKINVLPPHCPPHIVSS